MSQACNNREKITQVIVAYMKGLPVPKDMPVEIRMEIRYAEATEQHGIHIGDPEADKPKKESNTAAKKLVEMYNNICTDLPKVRIVTPKREKTLVARLRERSMEDFAELFKKASASEFLCGENDRGWTANFDWLINETNMAKVLEGNFDNRQGAKKQQIAIQSFDANEAFEKAMKRAYG